ncbi:MAG: hypothetical protein WCP36_02485, partial [Methanomicrobiales archaeon]
SIIVVRDYICITGPITGRASATPGNSRPVTTGTKADRLSDLYKSVSFTGRAGHTTNGTISPAIGTTFPGTFWHIHYHLIIRS